MSGDIPTDQFSLNFAEIEYGYRPQKADGSLDAPVKAAYDLKANKEV
jgi:type VI secretion system secreted protein Hcp